MKKVISLILSIFICLNTFTSIVFSEPNVSDNFSADSYILFENNRGQILASKNTSNIYSSRLCSMIMTAIIVIENTANLNDYITVSSSYEKLSQKSTQLLVGNKYMINDLLYALLLENATDVAFVLSEHVSGNDNFLDLMNEKASIIGLENTVFYNFSDSPSEKTTLNDLSALISYCLENTDFRRIYSSNMHVWKNKNEETNEIISNQNSMFWMNDKVTGGLVSINKSTNTFTIVTSASNNNLDLVSILLYSNPAQYTNDINNLFNYGFGNYRRDVLANKNEVIWTVNISEHTVDLVPNIDIYYTFPINGNESGSFIEDVKYHLYEDISFPIDTNKPLAEVTYYLMDNSEIEFNLYSTKEILLKDSTLNIFLDKIKEQKDIFNIIIILSFLLLVLVIYKLIILLKKHWH